MLLLGDSYVAGHDLGFDAPPGLWSTRSVVNQLVSPRLALAGSGRTTESIPLDE